MAAVSGRCKGRLRYCGSATHRSAWWSSRAAFHVRDCYECHGLVPEDYDCVVIKTPHAQPEMYDDWCLRNFNCDCEGATSANVRTLGHTIARRPLYPLEGAARRQSGGDKYPLHERTLGEDFTWVPAVEVYSRASQQR